MDILLSRVVVVASEEWGTVAGGLDELVRLVELQPVPGQGEDELEDDVLARLALDAPYQP